VVLISELTVTVSLAQVKAKFSELLAVRIQGVRRDLCGGRAGRVNMRPRCAAAGDAGGGVAPCLDFQSCHWYPKSGGEGERTVAASRLRGHEEVAVVNQPNLTQLAFHGPRQLRMTCNKGPILAQNTA
jgi:hypothetical protein